MPHSWVQVPFGTSDDLKACMKEDRKKFKECVAKLVDDSGGSTVEVYLEVPSHGETHKFARVLVEVPDDAVTERIVERLGATDRLDLLDFDDWLDEQERNAESAY